MHQREEAGSCPLAETKECEHGEPHEWNEECSVFCSGSFDGTALCEVVE